MNKFSWSRSGGYQVSSNGDARFSALNAVMPDGRTIEMHYQCDTKRIDPGGVDWRLGKGKPSINPRHQNNPQLLYQDYLDLWKIWANMNQDLILELSARAKENNYVLSDMFASTDINQARALADILNEMNK